MILPHTPDVIIEFAESNGHCAQDLWDREYEQAPTNPSSLRAAPAHALVELMKTYEFPAARALDFGCGNGRNSLFLASLGMRVTALDFCPKAVALTLERVEDSVKVLLRHNHDAAVCTIQGREPNRYFIDR